MSSRRKSDWIEVELLAETPRVIHAPHDPFSDGDGFVALPCPTPPAERPAMGWLQWLSLGTDWVAGEA